MITVRSDPRAGYPQMMPDLAPRDFAERVLAGLAQAAPDGGEPILAIGADQALRERIAAATKGPTESVEVPQPGAAPGALKRFRISRVMGDPRAVFAAVVACLMSDEGAPLINPAATVDPSWTDLRQICEFLRGVLKPGMAETLAAEQHLALTRFSPEVQAAALIRLLTSPDGAKYLRNGSIDTPSMERLLAIVTTHFPEVPYQGALKLARSNQRRIPMGDEGTAVRAIASMLRARPTAKLYGLDDPIGPADIRLRYRSPARERQLYADSPY